MEKIWKDIIKSAHNLTTTRDIHKGLTTAQTELRPANIVIFNRTRLRSQDYAGAIHHRYVLALFLAGPGTVFIQRHRFSAKEKQAVLIRPFEQHYYALPPKNMIWTFITFGLPETQSFAFTHQCAPLTDEALQTLQKLMKAYEKGKADTCRLLLTLLLDEINQHQPKTPGNPLPADFEQTLADQINSYIHDQIKKRFTINDISRHCGISSGHLRSKFRQTMDVSLGGHIQRIRFDRASSLLQTTNLTVSEIAYQCGFTSPAVFCRAFKNKTGTPPNAFRKKSRSSAQKR